MAINYDKRIVSTAERLVKKLRAGRCYTQNGEFLPPVKQEIERLKNHCKAALCAGEQT